MYNFDVNVKKWEGLCGDFPFQVFHPRFKVLDVPGEAVMFFAADDDFIEPVDAFIGFIDASVGIVDTLVGFADHRYQLVTDRIDASVTGSPSFDNVIGDLS